jgi:hypothetical protein
VDLAKAQDVEVGDGTTTVTVLAGALLAGCQDLLAKGIHPTTIAEGYQRAAAFAIEILRSISEKVCYMFRCFLLDFLRDLCIIPFRIFFFESLPTLGGSVKQRFFNSKRKDLIKFKNCLSVF